MAKKKTTHLHKHPKNQEQIHQTLAMEDASEKLESLKSLNAMLLKETVERRQQVDSLIQSNGCLESELTQAEMEKRALQDELSRLSDRAVVLEIERDLVSEFVSVQVNQQGEVIEKETDGLWRERVEMKETMESLEREMKRVVREKNEIEKARSEKGSEIGVLKKRLDELLVEIGKEKGVSSWVCKERDAIRTQLGAQIEEANWLRVNLIEAEKREIEIEKEVRKLNIDYEGIVQEKEERKRRIESILKDKDSIERGLVESNKLVDEMKREIEEMAREKEEIEEAKNVQERKKNELANTVSGLNEIILSLKKEEEMLREKVADMVKRCDEGLEKQMRMGMEIDGLVEEKKEREKSFESLIEEKDSVMKDLDRAMKNIDCQKFIIEQMGREKIEIEVAKSHGESEILELKKQLGECRVTIPSLEESHMVQIEKLKQLESEVSHYRAAFDQATTERNEAREGLDQEKINGRKLREKISGMEKDIEEMLKVLGEFKEKNGKLGGEKNELERRCALLMKDISLVENKLVEIRKEYEEMKGKVGIADVNSKLVLNILRNTATLICLSKEDEMGALNDSVVVEEKGFGGEEIKQYVAELEEIKKTFKIRESKVEDMKRELEFLQNSVAKAQKGKSFWTLVSSATTILAAASLAYVARGH